MAQRTLLMLGVVAASCAAGLVLFIVPQFAAVLDPFGADLPLLTYAVRRAYPIALVLPFLVLVVWRFWPYALTRGLAALSAGVLSLAVVPPAALFAMYLPLLLLAS